MAASRRNTHVTTSQAHRIQDPHSCSAHVHGERSQDQCTRRCIEAVFLLNTDRFAVITQGTVRRFPVCLICSGPPPSDGCSVRLRSWACRRAEQGLLASPSHPHPPFSVLAVMQLDYNLIRAQTASLSYKCARARPPLSAYLSLKHPHLADSPLPSSAHSPPTASP